MTVLRPYSIHFGLSAHPMQHGVPFYPTSSTVLRVWTVRPSDATWCAFLSTVHPRLALVVQYKYRMVRPEDLSSSAKPTPLRLRLPERFGV